MVDEGERLLIVEDDPGLQKQLKWCFDDVSVLVVSNREQALAIVRRHAPAVVLQDLGLPPDATGIREGMQCVREILAIAPFTKIIVVTGNGERNNALGAIAAGAFDFYSKPVDADILKLIVARAFRIHALEAENRRLAVERSLSPLAGIVATDEATLKACRVVEKVAPTDVSVLVLGESGAGKELFARALHDLSGRREGRFVAINCAAIPEQLLEAELFGHEKGAFTGAIKQTLGKVELASDGTLFLDEIGDMPASLQAKLLRFLQERVIERIGGREQVPVNVRVVCATNQDLQALIAQQKFRPDLYYRISGVTLSIPPLRARGAGITVLAQSLLRRIGSELKSRIIGFTDDAVAAMQAYDWPGNVRELENKIRGALIMAEGAQLSAADLGLSGPGRPATLNLTEVRVAAERQAVIQALSLANNNISRAADILGVSRPTLYDLMSRCGLNERHE